MSISKKKSLVNGKDTAKAKIKEIERELTAAQPVFRSGKDKKYFMELCDNIKNSLCPQNDIENELVEQIACSMWKRKRLEVMEQAIFKEYSDLDGVRWFDLLRTNYLEKITRYDQEITNYLYKLINMFKDRPVLSQPAKGKSMNLVKSGVG